MMLSPSIYKLKKQTLSHSLSLSLIFSLVFSQNIFAIKIYCMKKLNSVTDIVSDCKYKINHSLIKMSRFEKYF